jgi:stearoyl-CoA desaturase (delta-9 desaturase)
MSILIKRTLTHHWLKVLIVTPMILIGAWQFAEVLQNFGTQWHWLILATLYTITINDVFTHRTCSHRMFNVNVQSVWYKILTFLSSVDQGHGPVRTGAIWHFAHHKYSDQGEWDNVNARLFWYGDAWLLPFSFLGPGPKPPNAKELIDRSHNAFNDIIDDPWTQFCERQVLTISAGTLIILFFIAPIFLFKVLLLGRFIMSLGMVGAGIAHLQNVPLTYRNFDTPDSTNNNLILHYLFLGMFGGLLQNNHHAKPNALNTGSRWWEIDVSTPIAHLLKFLMAKKRPYAVQK